MNDRTPTGFLRSRRDAIRLLALGAGCSVVKASGSTAAFAASGSNEPLAPAQATRGIPRNAIVRTLLKDVPVASLGTGAVLFHEHLSVNFNRGKETTPPERAEKDDVDAIVQLVAKAGAQGVSCIVDGGHRDMGRDLDTLRQVASHTKVHVVASGGYYTQASYPKSVSTTSEDDLAEALATEATASRYGAFGEIGQAPNLAEMTADERKVFRAVGKAHVRTGLPIFTHNAYGTGPNVPRDAGLRQLDTLEAVGVKPSNVVIGHTCCLDDPKAEIASQLARRGAFVGFDRLTYIQFVPDDKKVAMILALLAAGHADRLLLSSDFPGWRGVKPWVPTLEQGTGWERTLTVFVPMLRKAGVPEATLHEIVVDNPRRFLAFVPAR